MADTDARGAIMIPNDAEAKKLFDGSQWNWENLPDHAEMKRRLSSLNARAILLLERGNENEGAYGVVCVAQTDENRAILLTNFDSSVREKRSIRTMPIDVKVVSSLLERLGEPRESWQSLPPEEYEVEDGSAFFLSWRRNGLTSRVYLDTLYVGDDSRRTGCAAADRIINTVNGVIQDLYTLVQDTSTLMANTDARGAIMIPNDAEAKEFFDNSQWNWENRPDHAEMKRRLGPLNARAILLLETGNEQAGSYGVVCAVQTDENQAILLTNYDSNLRQKMLIRTMPLDVKVVASLLERLGEPRAIEQTLLAYDYYVNDGSAFFLSWRRNGLEYRVCLFQGFLEEVPEQTGCAAADRIINTVNGVIQDLYGLVRGTRSPARESG